MNEQPIVFYGTIQPNGEIYANDSYTGQARKLGVVLNVYEELRNKCEGYESSYASVCQTCAEFKDILIQNKLLEPDPPTPEENAQKQTEMLARAEEQLAKMGATLEQSQQMNARMLQYLERLEANKELHYGEPAKPFLTGKDDSGHGKQVGKTATKP